MADYVHITTDSDGTAVWTPNSAGHYAYYGDVVFYGDPIYRPPRELPPAAGWSATRRTTEAPFGGHDPCEAGQNKEGKEETEMIQRQTFLDALADEGKTITVEERELIRCAMDDKWTLFIACLLARVFEASDLAMLKEKPKEVVILVEEE